MTELGHVPLDAFVSIPAGKKQMWVEEDTRPVDNPKITGVVAKHAPEGTLVKIDPVNTVRITVNREEKILKGAAWFGSKTLVDIIYQ